MNYKLLIVKNTVWNWSRLLCHSLSKSDTLSSESSQKESSPQSESNIQLEALKQKP